MSFRIRFELRELSHVQPWGSSPNLNLSWFGLTDGAYCIETPAGRLLDFQGVAPAGLSVTWCDYQVARLFEDLIDAFPAIMEPVPSDVIDRFQRWETTPASRDAPEDDGLAETWFRAQAWWGRRQLDFGYLAASPKLHFWRAHDVIHGRWRVSPDNPAAAQVTLREADFAVAAGDFELSVRAFFRTFLNQMGERVSSIARAGWTGQPCHLDIARLIAEQSEREAEPENRANLKRETDWDQVRHDLNVLGA